MSIRRRSWCRTACSCDPTSARSGAEIRRDGAQEVARPDAGDPFDLLLDGTLDQQYISNYATINIKDVLTRVDGVGDTLVFGARDFSMRISLDPAKIQARGLAADDVVSALRTNNVAVSAGAINQPPAKSPGGFQIAVQTLGRLASTEQFGDIVVATDRDGRVTRVRDIARVELGSRTTPRTPISTTRSRPRSQFSSGRARMRFQPLRRCSRRWNSLRKTFHQA